MSVALADLDVHDKDYCALNCRAGILAAILRTGLGIDPTPIFARTAIDSRLMIEPIERGEIAGGTFGAFANETWTELFGAQVVEWHPLSRKEMVDSLDAALRDHGMVMAAHDGYFDPLAADKYQRRHMRHNSLVYGFADNGYLIADRTYRSTIDAETLWRCMAEETTTFVTLADARPYAGDWAAELSVGAQRFHAAMSATLTDDAITRLVAAMAADLATPEDRWLQTHLYFIGLGRSRALFAQALAYEPDRTPGLAELSAALENAANAWVLTGRWIYKRLAAARPIIVDDLTARIRTAEAADAVVGK
jgi:hypothetical protein